MRRKPRARTKEGGHQSYQEIKPRPHHHVRTRLRPDQAVKASTWSKIAHRPELRRIEAQPTPRHCQAGQRKEPALTA
ncbi:unnamed protein product [Sphagnum tenellum]